MLYTTREVADELRCSPVTVRRMARDGRIPPANFTRIGRDYRFGKLDPRKHGAPERTPAQST